MFQVYAFATPNSVRVPIALEEMDLGYELISINVRKGEQKQADYLAINPNGKVPVLVDPEGPEDSPLILTESGAILIYLAEKSGKLLPSSGVARARVFEQMFFHVTGIGPAFGQVGFFMRQAPEQIPLAIDRYQKESERVLQVLEGVLQKHPFVAGPEFTIADITHFGWMWRREFAGVGLESTPRLAEWYARMEERPAIKRAVERVSALIPA